MNNAVLESELSRAYDKMELLREETARLKERVRVLEGALKPFADLGVGSGPDNEVDSQPYRILRGAIRRARSALHTTPEVGE